MLPDFAGEKSQIERAAAGRIATGRRSRAKFRDIGRTFRCRLSVAGPIIGGTPALWMAFRDFVARHSRTNAKIERPVNTSHATAGRGHQMNQDRHSSLASRHLDGWQNANVPQAARSGKPKSSDGPSSPRLPQDFAQERNGFVRERNVGFIPGKLMLDGRCSALALLPGRT